METAPADGTGRELLLVLIRIHKDYDEHHLQNEADQNERKFLNFQKSYGLHTPFLSQVPLWTLATCLACQRKTRRKIFDYPIYCDMSRQT